jgi:hypothetical protein
MDTQIAQNDRIEQLRKSITRHHIELQKLKAELYTGAAADEVRKSVYLSRVWQDGAARNFQSLARKIRRSRLVAIGGQS